MQTRPLNEAHGPAYQPASTTAGDTAAHVPSVSALLQSCLNKIAASPAECLALAFLLAQTIWTFHATASIRQYSDELHHFSQIQSFCQRTSAVRYTVPMLPGYHAVSAAIGLFTHDCSLRAMRRINAICGLLVTLTAYLILTTLKSERPVSRALAFHFLPVLFPYEFIVYTEAFSVLFGLWTVLLALRNRWVAAGLIGSLGIVVRQSNIVMLLFPLLLAAGHIDIDAPAAQSFARYFQRTWTCFLGISGLGIFAIVNHGITLGPAAPYHRASLHVANVYLLLALIAATSLPVVAATLWHRRALLTSLGFLTGLLTVFIVYMRWFEVTHPWNTQPIHFARNAILAWANASYLSKMLFFVPMAVGFAALVGTPLLRLGAWIWLPTSIALLVPLELIEHRYCILPLGLWMLFRRDSSPTAEALSVVSNAVTSIWLLLLVVRYGLWL